MFVLIDPTLPTPVFAQIVASVSTEIATGALTTGERLPPARQLAETLGINVHTVLHAYQVLRDDGLIELRRGRGAVVVGASATQSFNGAVSRVAGEAKAAGIPLSTLIALIRKEYES